MMPISDFCYAGEEISSGHSIAISIGGPAIAGIGYRKFFDNRLGLQSSFLAFPSGNKVGVFFANHMFYTLNNNPKNIRFYALIGSTVLIENLKFLIIIPGIGAGVEFSLKKNLFLSFELAAAPIINLNKEQDLGYIPLPIPGLVLSYYI